MVDLLETLNQKRVAAGWLSSSEKLRASRGKV